MQISRNSFCCRTLGLLFLGILGCAAPLTAVADQTISQQEIAEPDSAQREQDSPQPEIAEQHTVSNDSTGEERAAWVDTGHRFATHQTMALTRWVDNFFGDVDGDTEVAESRLRLKVSTTWDPRLDSNNRITLGGKVDLPQLANRVDLVFRGDDPDELIGGDRDDPSQSKVGLQINLDDNVAGKHRTDFTVGLSSSGPKPGFKYRYHTMWSPNTAVRFSQRAQYDIDDGAYATTKLDIDYALSERSLLRSQTRVLYGRDSDGAEWSTNFGRVRQWTNDDNFERASFLYAEVQGHTEPYGYVKNYQIGLRFRAQALREFLFFELEPTFNRRIDEPYSARRDAWALEARVEFLLFD